MGLVSGCYWSTKQNASKLLPLQPLENFIPGLSADREYIIGIDQSTACTGIAIADTNFDFFVMLDVINDNPNKQRYYEELKALFLRMFKGITIPLLIHEKPVPSKWGYTGNILKELVGKLEDWLNDDRLNIGRMEGLFPQEWRKFIVDKTKPGGYKGSKKVQREYVKSLVAEDVCALCPLASTYRNVTTVHSYDSFDALGILLGYMQYAYTPDGVPKICGSEEKTHVSIAAFRYLSPQELEGTDPLLGIFGEFKSFFEPVVLAYNTDYNLFTNIRKATSKWKSVVTILPDKEIAKLQLEFGFNRIPGGKMLLYTFRKGMLATGESHFVDITFPMKKEVYPIR